MGASRGSDVGEGSDAVIAQSANGDTMIDNSQFEAPDLTRRDFGQGLAAFVGLASTSGLVGLTSEAEAASISMSEVERLMSRGSVDAILREEYSSGLIDRVRYNGTRTNFKELVFQEGLSASDKKPVLVMFYNHKTDEGFSLREAIIFKKLAEEYQGKVKFATYDISVQPDYTRSMGVSNFGR